MVRRQSRVVICQTRSCIVDSTNEVGQAVIIGNQSQSYRICISDWIIAARLVMLEKEVF